MHTAIYKISFFIVISFFMPVGAMHDQPDLATLKQERLSLYRALGIERSQQTKLENSFSFKQHYQDRLEVLKRIQFLRKALLLQDRAIIDCDQMVSATFDVKRAEEVFLQERKRLGFTVIKKNTSSFLAAFPIQSADAIAIALRHRFLFKQSAMSDQQRAVLQQKVKGWLNHGNKEVRAMAQYLSAEYETITYDKKLAGLGPKAADQVAVCNDHEQMSQELTQCYKELLQSSLSLKQRFILLCNFSKQATNYKVWNAQELGCLKRLHEIADGYKRKQRILNALYKNLGALQCIISMMPYTDDIAQYYQESDGIWFADHFDHVDSAPSLEKSPLDVTAQKTASPKKNQKKKKKKQKKAPVTFNGAEYQSDNAQKSLEKPSKHEIDDMNNDILEQTDEWIHINDANNGITIKIFKTNEDNKPDHGSPLAYTSWIKQWFEDPHNAFTMQGYTDPHNKKYTTMRNFDRIKIVHSFTPIVDRFLPQWGKQAHTKSRKVHGKQDILLTLPGCIYYADGSYETGIFVYIIDSQNGVCYHRNFSARSGTELVGEFYQKGYFDYDMEFPPLS